MTKQQYLKASEILNRGNGGVLAEDTPEWSKLPLLVRLEANEQWNLWRSEEDKRKYQMIQEMEASEAAVEEGWLTI
jgi:hypothetical protein